jgi:hypothetical protein
MNFKICFFIILLLFTVEIIFIACDSKPTKPEYDNVFDPDNPTTSGDPFQLQVIIGNGGVTLTWTKPDIRNLSSFKIYRSEQENTGYAAMNTIAAILTEFVDQSAKNGHSYWYRVAAVDASGNETGTTNISAINIKTDPVLVINSGDEYTPTKEVNLTILANNAQQMMLSNIGDFTGATWETYSITKNWVLLTGEGEKIVFIKIKYSDDIESIAVADTIYPQPLNPGIVINNEDEYTQSKNVTLQFEAIGATEMFISNTSFDKEELLQGKSIEPQNSRREEEEKPEIKKLKFQSNVKIEETKNWQTFTATKNWDLLTGDSVKTVYAKYRNDFEIESSLINDIITLDTTPPMPILVVTPDSGITNETIFQFDPADSYDNILSSDLLQVRFDWENDGNYDTTWEQISIINKLYSLGGGRKTIKMEIQDGAGWTADTTQIFFVNTRPVAAFIISVDTSNNHLVHFDASSSSDYEDGNNLEYRWDWENDGIWDTGFVNNPIIYHEYLISGNYTPLMMIRDTYHLQDTTKKQLSISISIQFSKTYGGVEDDYANSVLPLSDGSYIVSGRTRSFGSGESDFWLVKTDANGNQVWDQTYGGSDLDLPRSVEHTNDGGYIIAGYTRSYGAGENDIYLVKTDASGNQQWDKTYGGSGGELARKVIQTSDGGYIVVGYTSSFGSGEYDMWLIKTNANGEHEWDKLYGGLNYDGGNSVIQTNDKGYIIVGYTMSFGSGESDIWIVKTDSSGNQQWDQTFGGMNYDASHSVELTDDGGYLIVGSTGSFGVGERDLWLVKTDATGNQIWDQTYGGSDFDGANAIQHTIDGGYIIAGYTRSFGSGGDDFLLIKIR